MNCRVCSNISGHLLLLYASNCPHRLILTNNFSLPVCRILFVNEHFNYLASNSMHEVVASSVTCTSGLLWVWICVNFTGFPDVCVGFFQKSALILPIIVNMTVNGCLSLTSPRYSHLSPAECWDRLQLHKTLKTIFCWMHSNKRCGHTWKTSLFLMPQCHKV